MRSSSIFTALPSASVIALFSAVAFAQAPQPQPQPAPGAPWTPAPGGQAPVPPAAQPGTPPTAPPGSAPGMPPSFTPGAPAQGAFPGQNPYYGPPTGPAAPTGPQPGPGAPPPAGFGAASASGSVGASLDAQGGASAEGAPAEETIEDRNRSLQEHNSIYGSTGLLRTVEAGSGAAGTFRVHFLMDWFQTSSFLCYGLNPCPVTGTGGRAADPDSATHFGANVGLSVTPVNFLEAYATIRSSSNYNDRGLPKLLQVLGDSMLGVKAFTPTKIGQALSYGGAADLLLMNGAGGVGIDSGSTSFRFNGIGTLDLRQPNDGGAPLRIHLNLGYLFDNSGNLVTDVEAQRKQVRDQRGDKITRVERFGLGINRVDQFLISIGAEGTFPVIRPFIEYHLGIASNRQGYECNPKPRVANGDNCLHDADFSAMPSTLTLGLRAYPFLKGFEVLGAFDIGTTGTSLFIEELAPTPQWDLWLGAGFAIDAQEPPQPKPQFVDRPVAVATERRIRGFVHEKDKQEGIANAIVRFDGRDLTGLVTGADGRFVSASVDPGSYTMSIHADGYKDAQCTTVVSGAGASSLAPLAPGYGPTPPAGAPGAMPNAMLPGTAPPPAPGPGPMGMGFVDVDCPLESNPRTGSVSGAALDADTNVPVSGVSIRVVDTQGKEVGIAADGNGAFHMEGLQPGTVTVKAEADGYMLHVTSVDVRAREDSRADLQMHKRPKRGDVEIAGNEIKIKRQIHFETDSAKISVDSTGLLEEIADTLVRNPCLKQVEIQGHTDNTGAKDHNKVLSDQRASSVRDWLLSHNVESGRLIATGYGQDRPISPNVTPAGKERNRRVQFVIKDQEKGCGGRSSGGGSAPKGDKLPLPAEPKPAGDKKPKPAPLPF